MYSYTILIFSHILRAFLLSFLFLIFSFLFSVLSFLRRPSVQIYCISNILYIKNISYREDELQ